MALFKKLRVRSGGLEIAGWRAAACYAIGVALACALVLGAVVSESLMAGVKAAGALCAVAVPTVTLLWRALCGKGWRKARVSLPCAVAILATGVAATACVMWLLRDSLLLFVVCGSSLAFLVMHQVPRWIASELGALPERRGWPYWR